MDYKTEIIYINGVELEIIVEQDGTKWYPVTQFFKKVLLFKLLTENIITFQFLQTDCCKVYNNSLSFQAILRL